MDTAERIGSSRLGGRRLGLAVLMLLAAAALVVLRVNQGRAAAPPVFESGAAGDLPYAERGPFEAGWRSITVEPERGGSFAATLYYPATQGGQDKPLDMDAAPCPAVTFGHGFLQTPDRYSGTLEHLATWGFLVIASESAAGLSPDHAQFARDLGESLTHLERSNADEASWLFENVDTSAFGASGHSMGGGASILLAGADSRIRAVANLAAAETRPSAKAAMADLRVPFHLVVGSDDTIVPPRSTRQLFAAGPPPRVFTTIIGGSHCGFQTTAFPIGCDSGRLPPAEQQAIAGHLLVAFFSAYLADEMAAWPDTPDPVWGPGADADGRVERVADPGFTLAPNPSQATGPVGGIALHEIVVRNTGTAPAAYYLEVAPGAWSATLDPLVTETLPPGTEAAIRVSIGIPPDARPGGTLMVEVAAHPHGDRRTGAYGTLETLVVVAAPSATPEAPASTTPETPPPTGTGGPPPRTPPTQPHPVPGTATSAPAAGRLLLPAAIRR